MDHGKVSYRRLSNESDQEEKASLFTEDYKDKEDEVFAAEMQGSEHALSTTVKTNIQMEENGLGFILIQNGPYLQISGLVEKSAAAKDGKLRPGDVLLKIGHANVLGWTLRELRQLFHKTPIGTVLQFQVYRDFVALPQRWESVLNSIPERKGAELEGLPGYASGESWTSSEESDEALRDDIVSHRIVHPNAAVREKIVKVKAAPRHRPVRADADVRDKAHHGRPARSDAAIRDKALHGRPARSDAAVHDKALHGRPARSDAAVHDKALHGRPARSDAAVRDKAHHGRPARSDAAVCDKTHHGRPARSDAAVHDKALHGRPARSDAAVRDKAHHGRPARSDAAVCDKTHHGRPARSDAAVHDKALHGRPARSDAAVRDKAHHGRPARSDAAVRDKAHHGRPARSDAAVRDKVASSFHFDPSREPKWLSKDWHILERRMHTFTVGSDIGCDIMVHKDIDADSVTDMTAQYLSCSSPYWTMQKGDAKSSSSSSSVSDAFWLQDCACPLE